MAVREFAGSRGRDELAALAGVAFARDPRPPERSIPDLEHVLDIVLGPEPVSVFVELDLIMGVLTPAG